MEEKIKELSTGIDLTSSLMNYLSNKEGYFDVKDSLHDLYNSLTDERFELLKK